MTLKKQHGIIMQIMPPLNTYKNQNTNKVLLRGFYSGKTEYVEPKCTATHWFPGKVWGEAAQTEKTDNMWQNFTSRITLLNIVGESNTLLDCLVGN